MQTQVNQMIAALGDKLIARRRDLHRHPESGWTEFRTSSIIAKTLIDIGYEVKLGEQIICRESMMGVPTEEELQAHMERAISQGADPDLVKQMAGGLTGVVGELKCGAGPLLVLRFDIDANDISEATDEKHLPYREGFNSINPKVMHACGHDGHVSIGLAVAEILYKLKQQLNGTIRLVFQPGEEGVRGAGPMVDAGVLEGADYILGGHIGFQATKTGMLICSTDKFLATTKFDVTFTGVPAHAGGAPEKGRNALLAASCAALNLHAIPRHGQGASRMTVGTLQAGQGRNVIPPNALLKAESRGETSEIDDFMFASAKQVIAGAAQMYGVDFDIKLMGKTKSGQSSPEMMARVKRVAEQIDFFDPEQIIENTEMRGSEDYSHMMTVVQEHGGQGTYFMIGSDLAAGHHDFYFDFDEKSLAAGVELIVNCVLDLLA
ncbi:aminobenzoyl-glutamate utilization protein A [Desulfuromusa kysingii]|uniref:Aminobenzoyl-glutamate utilization protein A n=1 Tax=Desulfuromusa kysingii TaxID=37625 RepID=A0A1H4DG19_9BACT|nr:amidohydrolase [Desulfuromusa kysingii]SEA71380.1 aminobenzoyl-glutamate utilization protein A [Desulfuromusa kysingii]